MILRRYRIDCPLCAKRKVVVRDVPSQAYLENYKLPEHRKPVPADDCWRYKAETACSGCAASATAIGEHVTSAGLPDDREDVS